MLGQVGPFVLRWSSSYAAANHNAAVCPSPRSTSRAGCDRTSETPEMTAIAVPIGT